MREQVTSYESDLIEEIVDRYGDDLQGRIKLRKQLQGKSRQELEKIRRDSRNLKQDC